MTQDEERYFESYFDLFSTQGWKQFIEDMDGIQETLNDILSIKDSDDYLVRKGQAQIVNRILGFEDAIKFAYKEQKGTNE